MAAEAASAARERKVAVVEEIRTKLTDADASVLTDYRGLSVGDLAELRASLRTAGAEYKVFKNTLARLAVEEAGLSDLLPLLEGPVAFTFISGDAVVATKALADFARTNDALVLKGGLLGDRVLRAAEVAELATIQPREVLLARLAGGFQAPMTKAAGLFQAFTRNFAYGLSAYIETRGAEAQLQPEVVEESEVDQPEEAAESAGADTPEPAADESETNSDREQES
jgi:large subunit ribosomal protein L10